MRVMLLVGCLFVAGCAPGPRIVTLQEFEATPELQAGTNTTVVLRSGCEFQSAAAGDLPAGFVDDSTLADAGVLMVAAATSPQPLVSCRVDIVTTGSSGFMTPGTMGPNGMYMPGFYVPGNISFEWKHLTSQRFVAHRIQNLGEHLVCSLLAVGGGAAGDVFVRKPGLEHLLAEAATSIHPGYTPVRSDAWIVVDKSWVQHLQPAKSVAAVADADQDEPIERPEVAEARSEFVDSAPLTCENIERRVDSVAEDERWIYTPALAACLGAQGEDERAIALLEASIRDVGDDDFSPHGMLRWHYFELLCLSVLDDDLPRAVSAAAGYLHSSPADEELKPVFDYVPNVEASPMAEFIGARQAELEAAWPAFRRAFDEALEEAEGSG